MANHSILVAFSETMSDLWDHPSRCLCVSQTDFTRWVHQLLAIDKETRICLLWCLLSYCHRVCKVSQPTVNGAASEGVDRWHHRLLSGNSFQLWDWLPHVHKNTRNKDNYYSFTHKNSRRFHMVWPFPSNIHYTWHVPVFGFIRRSNKHNLLYYVW